MTTNTVEQLETRIATLSARNRELHNLRREIRAALEVGILRVRAGQVTGVDALLDVLGILAARRTP